MVMASAMPNRFSVDRCIAFNPGTGLAHNDAAQPIKLPGAPVGLPTHELRNMALARELEWCWSTINGEAKNIEVHHIWGDVISAATTSSCMTHVRTWHNQFMNAHSMDNFLVPGDAANATNQGT